MDWTLARLLGEHGLDGLARAHAGPADDKEVKPRFVDLGAERDRLERAGLTDETADRRKLGGGDEGQARQIGRAKRRPAGKGGMVLLGVVAASFTSPPRPLLSRSYPRNRSERQAPGGSAHRFGGRPRSRSDRRPRRDRGTCLTFGRRLWRTPQSSLGSIMSSDRPQRNKRLRYLPRKGLR